MVPQHSNTAECRVTVLPTNSAAEPEGERSNDCKE